MPVKERNKVHNYAGRRLESEDMSLASMLVVPVTGLVLLGGIVAGMATDNIVVALAFLILMVAPLLAGVGWAMISAAVGPKEPNTPVIRQDDVHWSMLLVAFGDNQALWERLTRVLKNGGYQYDSKLAWRAHYETPLMRELDDIVSMFMTSTYPTVEGARSVRTNVERIFAEYDQRELDATTTHEAAKEIEAAGEKQLFCFQVQMAYADTSRHMMAADSVALIQPRHP